MLHKNQQKMFKPASLIDIDLSLNVRLQEISFIPCISFQIGLEFQYVITVSGNTRNAHIEILCGNV